MGVYFTKGKSGLQGKKKTSAPALFLRFLKKGVDLGFGFGNF